MASRIGRLLPAVVITAGNPDSVNDAPPTTTTVGSAYDLTGQKGALYRSNDGQKEWIYAQLSATGTGLTPAANQMCYWLSSTSTTLDPTWVVDNNTTASNANIAFPAGVLRVAATRGNYVWLLRKAPSANVASTSTGCVKGNIVLTSTIAGAVTCSTSTVIDAAGLQNTVGVNSAAQVGVVNSTTTTSVNLDVCLFIN